MAGSKYMRIARKLQTACKKQFNVKLLIDQRQWYHKDKDMAINMYTLYQILFNDVGKETKIKLFHTYSQIQLVLFLRDFWYELNGWEIPTDNKVWEEIKQNYGKKQEPSDQTPSITTSTTCDAATGRVNDTDRTAISDELYTSWKRNRSREIDSGIEEKDKSKLL